MHLTTVSRSLSHSAVQSWIIVTAACGCLVACGGGGSSAANQAPVASATLNGEAVLNAATIFDTSGSKDPDGSIASRSWSYGDGQTGSSDSHIYASTGSFTATLTVTDNSGSTASTSVALTVKKCSAAGTQAATLSPFTTLCVQTSRGEMVFEVFVAQAPITAANFLRYVDDGFYSGLLVHRVIPGFVIQTGGYLPSLVPRAATHPAIALESNNGLKNWRYTLAMARTSAPNSATSQFYVNLVDNPALDYNSTQASPNGYAVFGQVISGTSVMDAIGNVATTSVAAAGLTDVPVQDVLIQSVVRMP